MLPSTVHSWSSTELFGFSSSSRYVRTCRAELCLRQTAKLFRLTGESGAKEQNQSYHQCPGLQHGLSTSSALYTERPAGISIQCLGCFQRNKLLIKHLIFATSLTNKLRQEQKDHGAFPLKK